jgi:signal peptidase II
MSRRGTAIFVTVATLGLTLDLWSKAVAFKAVPHPRDRIVVVEGFFLIDHVRNPGMAWSLFQDVPGAVWIVLRSGLTLALIWLYAKTVRPHGAPWWTHAAFGLLLAGALGNLYDNVFAEHGHVRDFLHFIFGGWSFPVFNVADAMITVGAPLLFVHVARHDRRTAEQSRRTEGAGAAGTAP